VVITTGGDVQFHLTLPAAIPETLRLRIQFVAEDNMRNVQSRTSTGACTNLRYFTKFRIHKCHFNVSMFKSMSGHMYQLT